MKSFQSKPMQESGSAPGPDTETKEALKPPKWQTLVMLHVIIFLYSLAGICSKMAAGEQFGSLFFFIWYAGVLAILFIYAIVWQQVLRRLTLTTAFANKGVTVMWGMLWGALVFAEHISIWMMIGAVVVFVGIILVVSSDE